MAQPILILLQQNLKRWFSARGVWLVFLAALVPFILTGAWVMTHQKDVGITAVTWEPQNPKPGDTINFTAVFENLGKKTVGPFNISLRVDANEVIRIDEGSNFVTKTKIQRSIATLAPGESYVLRGNWTTTPGGNFSIPNVGTYILIAEADANDVLGEIDEHNNLYQEAFQIQWGPLGQDALGTLSMLPGNQSSPKRADAEVSKPTITPRDVVAGGNTTFSAVITNHGPDPIVDGTRYWFIYKIAEYPPRLRIDRVLTENETFSLGANESLTYTLNWNSGEVGFEYFVRAAVDVGQSARDAEPFNNDHHQRFFVDRQLAFPEPPERATIKEFYRDVLLLIQLRIIIPLIGLFYAAGVIADEREKGTLPYILTRPVQRWLIPVTKFASSFFVAAVPLALGILVSFGLLFGTPTRDVGFLSTPLLFSLLSLFVYGAFFIFIGVLVDRPYLIGIGFVIGWEAIAGNFVPWVRDLTLSRHLNATLENWPLDQGLVWLPMGKSLQELAIVGGVAVVSLIAASVYMKMREFDV